MEREKKKEERERGSDRDGTVMTFVVWQNHENNHYTVNIYAAKKIMRFCPFEKKNIYAK